MKLQLKHRIGIFGCDETIVISSINVSLGKNWKGDEVVTWVNPVSNVGMGNLAAPGVTTNSWLNTQIFITAFATILADTEKRVWHNDWLIKADPDAVFFSSRMRVHLKKHNGHAAYLVNCNSGGWKLYGSIEAFSKQAMGRYNDHAKKCLRLPWHGWGEDSYMQHCMDMLQVRAIPDFALVGDARCSYAPCSDQWRAAFHPFKDVGGYMNCYKSSMAAAKKIEEEKEREDDDNGN